MPSYHDVVALHLRLLIGQFVVFHFKTTMTDNSGMFFRQFKQTLCAYFVTVSKTISANLACQQRENDLLCSLHESPVILGLEELEFIFNPVTRLRYSKFEARLAGLMWSLKGKKV